MIIQLREREWLIAQIDGRAITCPSRLARSSTHAWANVGKFMITADRYETRPACSFSLMSKRTRRYCSLNAVAKVSR